MSGNVLGGIVGAAIGFFATGGNPAGAQWGWAIGSVAGGLLMPPEVEGPRLTDLRLQGSEYGRPIPIVYGTSVVTGNVIWQTDLEEVASDGGGKGGPEVTNYTYYANFAVLLCEGEVELGRIWAGPEKRLIYDGTTLEGGGTITFYNGSSTQLPDPLMESHEGVGNVPAYRGYAYIVFEDYPVANDGNRIPLLTVEVGSFLNATASLGTAWSGGQILTSASNYMVTYSRGSDAGILTRSLADNSFVSHTVIADSNITTWFYDSDRNRVVGRYGSNGFFVSDLSTGLTDFVNSLPGAPGLRNIVGGCYHNGEYVFLANHSGTGVCMDRVDPDTLASIAYTTGDAGQEVTLLCASRNSADSYVLGIRKGDHTLRQFPIGVSGFTSTLVNSVVDFNTYNPTLGDTSVAMDPNTGYIWSMAFNSGSGTIYVNCVDPATSTVLLDTGISTPAYTFAIGGARTAFPWVFQPYNGSTGGQVLILGTVWLAKDYVMVFHSGDGPTAPAYQYDVTGRYHGTGDMGGGLWNASLGEFWFVRQYMWFNKSKDVSGDFAQLALWDQDNTTYPGTGFYLAQQDMAAQGQTLSSIVQDLCVRAGIDVGDIDVTDLASDTVDGYSIVQQTSARGAIQVLQPAYFFDAVESQGVAKFVKRGGAVAAVIPEDEIGAYVAGSEPDKDLLLIKRQMEDELPGTVTVKYMHREVKYDVLTQQSTRLVGNSNDEQMIDLPLVMTDAKGKGVADVNLHKAWVGRKTFSFNMPRKYIYLEPTDVIEIRQQTMMLTKVVQSDGLLKCEAVFDDYNYAPHTVVTETVSTTPSTVSAPVPTNPVLMNLPSLRQQDTDAGFYAAASGSSNTWRGGTLYQSKDGGTTYVGVGTFRSAATMGITTDVLDAFTGGDTIDTTSSVNVVLSHGTLSSVDETAFLAGTNVAAVGDEVIFFRYATLETNGSYTLTRFKRGRFGSTAAVSTHAAGDDFVVLSTSTTIRVAGQPADIGESYLYKAVTFGQALSDVTAFTFVNTGASYNPSTPISVSQPATLFGRDSTTTTGLTWGYYGGAKLKSDGTIVLISAGTVTLTDNATNYIYATDAGVVTVTTSAPTGWPAPLASNATALYEVVTANGVVTSYIDYRTAGGASGGGGGLTSPLTTKGDVWVYGAADARLPVGSNTYVLTADSAQALGVKWALPHPLTTKGDLFTYGTVATRLAVGADGKVLSADSAEATGLKWIDVVSLSTVNTFTKAQIVAPSNLVDGATISVDASLSNNFNVTLGGNRTLANPTNLVAGQVLNFNIHQDATGGRTLAFGNLYKFPGGVNSISSTPNAKDFMSCYYDGTILKCNISKAYQ